MKRILAILISAANAQKRWTVNSLATVDDVVDRQTDLTWTLQSQEALKIGDCIQISIASPYLEDGADYQSFSAPFGKVSCTVENSQAYQCETLSETQLQISVVAVPTLQATQIQGRSTGLIFKNPYSARRLVDVTVQHLPKCDASKKALVSGTTRFPQFLPQSFSKDNIKLESSSQLIGDQAAMLTVSFTSKVTLKQQGRIVIKSPPWYQKQSTRQEGVQQDYYADFMIGFDSEATIEAAQGALIQVDGIQFDQSLKTFIINYQADRSFSGLITIKITDFKNPVTTNTVYGFQVSTTDQQGFLIEQSSSELSLATKITIPQLFNDVQIQMLGDEQGQNRGQISTLQTLQFQFSLLQPLEPFCYFVFKFPQTLQLGQNVQNIQGTGLFQPKAQAEQLNTGQYEIDQIKNQLKVEGCRLSDSLTANPFGTLTVSFVRMPDFVQTLEPIEVKVYSDSILANLVVSDPTNAQIKNSDMTAGWFTAELFRPSNFYASATKVAYTLFVRPQHGLTPQSRIIIDMPALLTFNRQDGCQVVLTICDCKLHPTKNELTLTNIFDSNIPGGTLLKFMILEATNPQGSRPTGPWSIRSETPVDGVFYVVDGQSFTESFTALSGIIFSDVSVDNLQVSSSKTSYAFQLRAEHDIPANGKLIVRFPIESPLKTNIEVVGFQDFKQTGNTLTFAVSNTIPAETPIKFTIKNVQNTRSFQPSSNFYIATTDVNDFIIDAGGQDIIIKCTEMAYFKNVTIDNMNKTNGAVDALNITVELQYPLWDGDILHLELPEDLSFGPVVSCFPFSLALNVTCTHSERFLYIQFDRVESETEIGALNVLAFGIRNPASLKPTASFPSIFTTDKNGYQSQSVTAKRISQLSLKTEKPATVQRFVVTQGTEEYGLEGSVTLQFYTENPIKPDGVIVINWSDSVTLFQNTFCQVTTFKQILQPNVCVFDFDKKVLRIQNAFKEMTNAFSGLVQIYLSRVQNPSTNEGLGDYSVTTFSESSLQYPVDEFRFQPKLKCFWSCQLCSSDKYYCTQCWPQRKPFLFQSQLASTCLEQCPSGFTSNGTFPPVCQQCDASCSTCLDSGRGGDVGRCLTCKPGFNFFQPVEGKTGLCLQECALGYYDDGQGTCLPCNAKCRTCSGSPDNCTSCLLNSTLPVLYQSRCIAECPYDHLDLAGVCEACISPCASCDVGTNLCTSCDGLFGFKYQYGVSCFTECPEGTRLSLKTNQCQGCKRGCLFCDIDNPDLCFKCSDEYVLFEGQCYVDCPEGSMTTFSGKGCRSMSEMEASLVYFPFLIVIILIAFVSWIGRKIKRAHLAFPNFVIMLGFIEHSALLVQVILSFALHKHAVAIPMLLIYAGYLVTQVLFNVQWYRTIADDSKYIQYCAHTKNQKSTRVRQILGAAINWKFHKLLYSRFFGGNVKEFRFSKHELVAQLFKKTLMGNIAVTWVPLLILNVISLALLAWGSQLYVMLIENVILAILCTIVGIIEHKQMVQHWEIQTKIAQKNKEVNSSLNRKRLLLNSYQAGRKDRPERFNFLFLQSKIDELLYVFGGRKCKSDFYDTLDKEQDDRQTYSWPLTPTKHRDDIRVDDPPIPLPCTHFNNCYAESKPKDELKQHNGEGYNKACQKGGLFDGDIKRHETSIIDGGGQSETETSEQGFGSRRDQKKRGRKNKYFRQIDREDHEAGTNLDSDNELANQLRYLDEIKEEDEILRQEGAATPIHKGSTIVRGIELPNASARTFNENQIMGQLDRNEKGQIVAKQVANRFFDLKQRRVTAQGYLLDENDDIVSAQDPTVKMFENVLNGQLPAPFSFERFNFNPYQMFGNFKGFKTNSDPTSYNRVTDSKGTYDSQTRQVNQQGFLVQDGFLVDQQGKRLFHPKQLVNNGCLPELYTYAGTQFQITDCMGTFRMTAQNQIIKTETRQVRGGVTYKDMSGHLVNDRGYLTNQQGDVVNRKGKVLFSKQHLKNGEFPKIFPFSKINMTLITGVFQLGQNGQPQLRQRAEGGFQDDNGVKVNEYGFLTDAKGNIVDHNSNIMFEKNILLANGQLPALFTSKKLLQKTESDNDIDQLLQLIDVDHKTGGSSYGSEMGDSPTKYDHQNQRPTANLKLNLLKQSQSVGKPINQRSEGSQSSRKDLSKIKKKQKVKLVKIEQYFDQDIKMAQAYGGEVVPRVRIVPQQRLQSTQRDRNLAGSLRESSYTQLKHAGRSIADSKRPSHQTELINPLQYRQPATITQLEKPVPNALMRPSSPSNAAFSIKDRMQARKQHRRDEQSDLDQELAELYEQDADKFIDGSNFEVESLSGFSGPSYGSFISMGKHQELQTKTKELEAEYLLKLEQQREQHKQQMERR